MSGSSPSNNELREAALAYGVRSSPDRLELPVNRDFASPPPRLTPTEYVAWCEEYMKLNPSGFARRLEDGAKVRPEFSL
jgi:hypothetical protein